MMLHLSLPGSDEISSALAAPAPEPSGRLAPAANALVYNALRIGGFQYAAAVPHKRLHYTSDFAVPQLGLGLPFN